MKIFQVVQLLIYLFLFFQNFFMLCSRCKNSKCMHTLNFLQNHLFGIIGKTQLMLCSVDLFLCPQWFIPWNILCPFSRWTARWTTIGFLSWIWRHIASFLLIYLPIWYCKISFKLYLVNTTNTVISLPLLIYLRMYFMDFTELQYTTLICDLKVFNKSGEYGTTHRLSI